MAKNTGPTKAEIKAQIVALGGAHGLAEMTKPQLVEALKKLQSPEVVTTVEVPASATAT
jgi:hypothetical protein